MRLRAHVAHDPGAPRHYSFHSHRITIARRLQATGEDWPTIQALVRWRSVESAMIYAQLRREEQAPSS